LDKKGDDKVAAHRQRCAELAVDPTDIPNPNHQTGELFARSDFANRVQKERDASLGH
jgi:hypothetical protein